jgi:hypothetical protein
VPADALAQALLDARTAEARAAALTALRGVEATIAPALVAALEASLDGANDGLELRASRLAVLDLLSRHADAAASERQRWQAVLLRCQEDAGLRAAALRTRAMIGDADALEDLTDFWLAALEQTQFLERLSAESGSRDAGDAATRARRRLTALGDGLRRLAEEPENLVFERLAAAYWRSWCWLGQDAGEGFAAELFSLARPAEDTLAFRPELVREPRDILSRVAQRGTPDARAAAGVILKQRAPQYKRLSTRVADILAEVLPTCDAAEQQRVTWALASLRGQRYGKAARRHWLELTGEEVAAALRSGSPAAVPRAHASYAGPPALSYRASTARGRQRRDLVEQLRGDWPGSWQAVRTWLQTDLGASPLLHPLLNPGQRRPDYPALAGGLVLVAVTGDDTCRAQLRLWCEATDQPAWVRALAYTVHGSLDARRGHWSSGWPGGLDLSKMGELDKGGPSWEHFGMVIAAGGVAMRERLETFEPLPAALRSRLLAAATDAEQRLQTWTQP